MSQQHAKIGRLVNYSGLSHVPDHLILVEVAKRTGNSISQIIKPTSPNQQQISLREWKNAVAAAQNVDFPNFNPLYDVYENIRIDLQLSSALETRILRVQQAKFNLVDKSGKPNTEAKALLQKQWFLEFLKQAMESQYEGYRLIEHIELDEEGQLKECKAVNKYHVKQKLGIVAKEQSDEVGQSYLEGNYQLYYSPVGDKDSLGILYKVAPMILAIKYAIAQWGEFNEKLGIPFRTVTTNANDSKRQQQLGVIMENMGSAGWAVLSEGEKVELLEMNQTDPTKCFESLIALLDARIATYLLGQSSTTSSDKNKGTYGSLQVLQEITQARHEADLTFIEYLINGVLLKKLPLISAAYKPLLNLRLDWDKSIEHTPKEVVDLVSTLEDNFEVDLEWITAKTGIPLIARKKNSLTTPPTVDPKKKSSVMIAELYTQQCEHCKVVVAADMPDFEQLMFNAARAIFDGKQKGILDNKLLNATAKYLMTGINGGYGIAEDDTDLKMIGSLQKNVWVFSGFKTYETLREVTNRLVDDKGTLRLWDEFKKEVLKVNQNYNVTYLRAEYDNAVVGARMSSYWQDIQANKKDLPYLKFVATEDARTTQICRSLDGTTLPVDHPFWLEHFLPLHWGERSLIQQVASGAVTPEGKVQDLIALVSKDIAPMFKNNVGISGVAFPETHPYFDQSSAVKKVVREAVDKLYIDPNDYKQVYKSKSGATVQVHKTHNKDELKANTATAKTIANSNRNVKLLRFTNEPGIKNPDAEVEDLVSDFKGVEACRKTSIQNAIRACAKQKANTAVITLPKKIDKQEIISGLLAAFQNRSYNKSVKEVLFIKGKSVYSVKRSEIEKGNTDLGF